MTAVALPRSYYRVVGATGLTNLADGIRLAAFPLVAASVTDSAVLVAAVFAAGQLPWILLGLWAGAVADRTDRRALLRRVTGLRTILLLALAVLVFVELTPLWLLIAAAFVLGLVEVLADTTTSTLVPMLVPAEHLERANSRVVASTIAGNELAGPAIGGLLFALGASLPFFTNASLLACALLLVAGLPVLQSPSDLGHDPEQPDSMFAGWSLIRSQPLLRAATWSSAILGAIDAAWFSLLVLFVRDELGLGGAGFGLLLAVGAIGGLGGAALADRRPNIGLRTVSLFVFASMAISLVALGAAPTTSATIVALVVTSAGFAVWNVFITSARQRVTPPDMLGRVGATYRTIVISSSLVGAIGGGLIADSVSITFALVAGGLGLAVTTPLVVAAFAPNTTAIPSPQ